MGRKHTGVYAASETSILITFSYAGARRKEYLKMPPTPTNLAAAGRLRAEIVAAVHEGSFDYLATFPESPRAKAFAAEHSGLLGPALLQWLEKARGYLQPSTYREYESSVRYHLVPTFGHMSLCELKRSDLRQWAGGLTISQKRIANVLCPLRAMLDEAVENGRLTANPVRGLKIRRREELNEEAHYHIDPLSQAEQAAVLAVLPEQVRQLIQFALWSGLRTSELLALRWGDIDWVGGIIHVVRARVAGHLKVPKTKAGRRNVKLLAPARDALVAQKRHTFMVGEEIFHNPVQNAPWGTSNPLYKVWTRRLLKAGVRHRPLYQTRHTYASMMLTAGEDPMWVAHQMGHTDWGMIRKIYARWIPEARPNAGNKAERLFGGKDGT